MKSFILPNIDIFSSKSGLVHITLTSRWVRASLFHNIPIAAFYEAGLDE